MTLANGVVTATSFDNANRVTSIAETKDGTELYSSLYFYDKTAARTKIVESRGGVVVRTSIYTYDATNKLLSENDGTSNIVYTYDDVDNRISKSVNGVLTSYAIDKLNRVLSSTTNGIVDATFTYDLNGNRASKTTGTITHNYTYDRENRLVSVSDASTPIFAAIYDYRTRRMSCIENAAEKKYIYDSGDCVQERDATKEEVQLLQKEAEGLGRKLHNADASIVGSAEREGATIITNDKRLGNFLEETGRAVEGH